MLTLQLLWGGTRWRGGGLVKTCHNKFFLMYLVKYVKGYIVVIALKYVLLKLPLHVSHLSKASVSQCVQIEINFSIIWAKLKGQELHIDTQVTGSTPLKKCIFVHLSLWYIHLPTWYARLVLDCFGANWLWNLIKVVRAILLEIGQMDEWDFTVEFWAIRLLCKVTHLSR